MKLEKRCSSITSASRILWSNLDSSSVQLLINGEGSEKSTKKKIKCQFDKFVEIQLTNVILKKQKWMRQKISLLQSEREFLCVIFLVYSFSTVIFAPHLGCESGEYHLTSWYRVAVKVFFLVDLARSELLLAGVSLECKFTLVKLEIKQYSCSEQ